MRGCCPWGSRVPSGCCFAAKGHFFQPNRKFNRYLKGHRNLCPTAEMLNQIIWLLLHQRPGASPAELSPLPSQEGLRCLSVTCRGHQHTQTISSSGREERPITPSTWSLPQRVNLSIHTRCCSGCDWANSSSPGTTAHKETLCLNLAGFFLSLGVVWGAPGLYLSSGFAFGRLLMKFCITQAKSPLLLLSSRLSRSSPAER